MPSIENHGTDNAAHCPNSVVDDNKGVEQDATSLTSVADEVSSPISRSDLSMLRSVRAMAADNSNASPISLQSGVLPLPVKPPRIRGLIKKVEQDKASCQLLNNSEVLLRRKLGYRKRKELLIWLKLDWVVNNFKECYINEIDSRRIEIEA